MHIVRLRVIRIENIYCTSLKKEEKKHPTRITNTIIRRAEYMILIRLLEKIQKHNY
jgi:hypothetical protein